MKIRVHFDDGSHEDRDADSVATTAGGVSRVGCVRGFVCVDVPRGDGRERCHVETVDEQIARLTRERDAEKARADALMQERNDALRAAAAWEKDYEAELARAEGLVRALVKEQTRADAAEKCLADLRAWAESESQRHERVGAHGVGGFYRAMVRRIDGKEST